MTKFYRLLILFDPVVFLRIVFSLSPLEDNKTLRKVPHSFVRINVDHIGKNLIDSSPARYSRKQHDSYFYRLEFKVITMRWTKVLLVNQVSSSQSNREIKIVILPGVCLPRSSKPDIAAPSPMV